MEGFFFGRGASDELNLTGGLWDTQGHSFPGHVNHDCCDSERNGLEWSGMVYQDVCFMKPQRIRQWQTRFESFNLQPTTELNCKALIPSFSSFLTSHIPHVTLFLSAPSLPDLVFSGCRSNRPWRCYTLCCRRRAGRCLPDDDPVCIQGTPDSL